MHRDNPFVAERRPGDAGAPSVGAAVVLFTKPPIPGRVKTRLAATIGAERAAALHAAFYDDLVRRLAESPWALFTAWALEPGETPPDDAPAPLVQRGDDLGARIHAALADAARRAEHVAALGVDCPDLPVETVDAAFDRLRAGSDVVVGPAEDGGYYLLAVHRRTLSPELFSGIPWSTAGVLGATRVRCAALGLRLDQLERRRDVDDAEDLAALVARLEAGAGGCPRTRAVLRRWGRLP